MNPLYENSGSILMQSCNTTLWMSSLVLICWISILLILEIVRYINQFYKKPAGQWTSFWIFANRMLNRERFSLSLKWHRIIVIIFFPMMLFLIFYLMFMPRLSLSGVLMMLGLSYFLLLSLLGFFKLQESWISNLSLKFQMLFIISMIIVFVLFISALSAIQLCL